MLRISQTYAQLGMETNWGRYEFKAQNAEISLQSTRGELIINREDPKVIIDQSECFSSAGRKGNYELATDFAQESYNNVLRYVSKKNSDGDMLRNIGIRAPKNMIAIIAQNDLIQKHDYNIDFIPKVRPKIEVTGSLSMEYRPGTIQSNSTDPSFSADFEKSKVNVYMKQWNSIQVEYIGSNVDIKL